ncbi:MAG TPA: ATP-dependent RecD-like DNA helicase [bacterium]|nr:ATP-dependent RecD-like DNA helicase [bacterium]HPN30662.1 ATP-dependent RecD-like DNA helicase [bacterium]
MNFENNIFSLRTGLSDLPEYLIQSKKISGVVEKIIFYNQENNFLIARLQITSSALSVPVKGKIIQPAEGMQLELDGYWDSDKIHGAQFNFISYEIIEPATRESIIRFLGSGLIKNIGIKTAEKITAFFGVETLQIIENFPERLIEVPGIGESKRKLIIDGYKTHLDVKKIMLFLSEHCVSVKFSYKLYSIYGNETVSVLKKNPYILISGVKGVGFKKADDIAKKIGIPADHNLRIASGLFYILSEAANEGHSYIPFEEFKRKAAELLNLEPEKINAVFANSSLLNENNMLIDEDRVYLKWNYFCETGITENLCRLLKTPNSALKFSGFELDKLIKKLSSDNHINLSPNQTKNIVSAIKEKIFVLTGGPGTGKTTITYFIVKILKRFNLETVLCSPTGRAAKRLSELTLEPAATIHRLLEYSPQTGFQKNDKNKLSADAIIIDEFSMTDLALFYNLLKAVKSESKLILIGDSNQLPSVGAGNLLSDILSSKKIPAGTLTEIFRQDEKSHIILNAHNIINNRSLIIKNSKTSDFFAINCDNKKECLDEILNLFENRLPKYGFKKDNIQTLAPVYKGILGVENLNSEIQKIIHKATPAQFFFQYGNALYKVKDRIIQLKNNYNKNIMNGDIGEVIATGAGFDELVSSAVDKKLVSLYLEKNNAVELNCNIMIARFDETIVNYSPADGDECALAYSITVHKSQGSEFDCVILPMTMDYYTNLTRNLIYTAITRAKKLCVAIGDLKALFYGIKRNLAEKRISYLAERLRKL